MDPSTEDTADADSGRSRFRRTLIRVMTVQVVALLLLWWLQSRYGGV